MLDTLAVVGQGRRGGGKIEAHLLAIVSVFHYLCRAHCADGVGRKGLRQCKISVNRAKDKQKMKKIMIINGPNLNLLGVREPGIYGSQSFADYLPLLCERVADAEISYFQSNVEGELIDKLQEVGFSFDGIVLNAGAYTHTSVALLDCIRSLRCPVVEVHISNVHQRESFRHRSMIAAGCKGVICGFGLKSYELAVRALIEE